MLRLTHADFHRLTHRSRSHWLCNRKAEYHQSEYCPADHESIYEPTGYPKLKGLFLGKYLGSLRRHIKRAAGKVKEMNSVSMVVPMDTLNASENERGTRNDLINRNLPEEYAR